MASTEIRSGLIYGWSPTSENFSAQMDANFLWLGRFGTHLSVKDRDLSTPPGSPATGDTYIIASSPTPTGAWAGNGTKATMWTGAAWVFAAPRTGWRAWVEDEEQVCAFTAGAWKAAESVKTQVNQTSGRALDTTYANTSPRSLLVTATARCAITVAAGNAYIQGVSDAAAPPTTIASGIVGVQSGLVGEDNSAQISFVVAPGMNYRVNSSTTNGTVTLGEWFETIL